MICDRSLRTAVASEHITYIPIGHLIFLGKIYNLPRKWCDSRCQMAPGPDMHKKQEKNAAFGQGSVWARHSFPCSWWRYPPITTSLELFPGDSPACYGWKLPEENNEIMHYLHYASSAGKQRTRDAWLSGINWHLSWLLRISKYPIPAPIDPVGGILFFFFFLTVAKIAEVPS